MSTDQPNLPWSDLVKVSATELLLLTGGEHLDKPEAQSWVTLATKPKTGDLRDWNLAALPVHKGNQYLPNFIEGVLDTVLDEDSYNSLQCMYRAASLGPDNPQYTHSKELAKILGPDGQRLRAAYRDAEGIARLNCCYVDIDYYNMGLTPGNVIGQIYDLQNEGKIPPPSYLKDSGQGLWAVWLLGIEPRSYAEHKAQWRAIQAQLHCMFSNAGSDSQSSSDLARLTRITGSKNTKCDRRANMVIFARDNEGQPIRYRLNELAESLGCRIAKRVKTDPLIKLAKSAKSVKGQIHRWKWDELRFWSLVETIRKRIPEGSRNAHCFVIGAILRHRHEVPAILDEEIHAAADRLFRRMERSKERSERYTLAKAVKDIQAAAKGKKRGSKIPAQKIANRLKLTTHEAEMLRDLHQTTSKGTWPPAQGQPEMAPRMDRAYRKSVILKWMVSKGFQVSPPSRELAEIIRDQLGMKVSHETINQYRKELRPPQPPPEMIQATIAFTDPTEPQETKGAVS
jgi:hypothetical protein